MKTFLYLNCQWKPLVSLLRYAMRLTTLGDLCGERMKKSLFLWHFRPWISI